MGCCVGFGFEGLTFLRWIRLGLERVFFLVDYVVIWITPLVLCFRRLL